MEEKKRDSEQENSKDFLIEELCGCSDEELLKEFNAASRLDGAVIPKPPEGEADIIWERIQIENADVEREENPEKVVRGRFGWKRVAAIGLIACILAGSGCFVAMGTKSYFMREKMIGNEPVLVNDTYKIDVNGENEAYQKIESELGVKPLKLAYIPDGMEFDNLEIEDGYASMDFMYLNNKIVFIQAKYAKSIAYDHKSESEKNKIVYNKWLGQNLIIEREVLSDGKMAYETDVVLDGGYYVFSGAMEEDEFVKIIERLSF